MSVILKQVSFTFTPDSLIKSWKKRLSTVVINTDTEYQIEYATLTNDSRLHNGDRETILRTEIKNIATEVLEEDKNSERGHCLNWCTADKMIIKDHW